MATKNLSPTPVMVVCVCVDENCGGELCESGCVCVCWGESRCSGADSSALCILKPPLPPAAKIELGDGAGGCMGVVVVWRGCGRKERKEGVT